MTQPVANACNTCNFLLAWGGYGSSPFFADPVGIAVGPSGNVYVAYDANNTVAKFTSTGTFLTAWGSSGSGPGQFNFALPLSVGGWVAVDSSGNVYVTDSGNNRVQKFTSTGTFLTAWGSSGSGPGQFNSPEGVAVDSSGNVYVVDNGNDRVDKFTSTGTFLIAWGSYSGYITCHGFTATANANYQSCSGQGQFSSPQGIAVDASGNVYVVDTGNERVEKFDDSGNYITQWGSYLNFGKPSGIAVDSTGNVYVADWSGNDVQKFDSSGNYISEWGSPGSGNGQFGIPGWAGPIGVCVGSSENVYVVDNGNNRVELFGDVAITTTSQPPSTTTSSTSVTSASSTETTMTLSSISSATTTGPSLKILSYSLSPAQPLWNSVFTVTVNIQNVGSENLLYVPQLFAYASDPSVDALRQAPTLTCAPQQNPLQNPIQPSLQASIMYNCIAQWNIEESPSFLRTFISSYANLGQEAVSTIAQSGDASKFAKSVLSPGGYNIFLEESQLAHIAMTGLTAAGDIEAAASVIELVASNAITIGVYYSLSLTSTDYQVTGPSDVVPVIMPDYKFSEIYQWAAANMADIAISGGLDVAATATVWGCSTLIGCLVPGVLFAAAALIGPVTDAVYQHLLTDPVANYTTIVSIAPVPSLITSLPNNTYSQLLYYEYEYKANLDASSQSSLLGYAAFQANSTRYANLQFARAESFASNASAYFLLFKDYLNATLLATAPSVDQTSFDQGVQMIRTSALPTPLVQILNATGTLGYFNSTAITKMTFQPMNSTVAQSIPNVGSYLESDASLRIAYAQASTSTSPTSTTTSSNASSPQPTTVPTSPAPGFPIESILAGLLGGLLALAIIRRRRKCSESSSR